LESIEPLQWHVESVHEQKGQQMINFRRKLVFFLFACLMMFPWGCVETSMMYQGNAAPSGQVAKSIEEGARCKDTFESFETIINYDYIRTGEALKISGQAALTERYPLNYSRLRRLDVYLFFLDKNSRVLETVQLARAMTGSLEEILKFDNVLRVPEGAVAISFGYDGEVTGTGVKGDGGIERFHHLPLSK
jgi:hypothetical protein